MFSSEIISLKANTNAIQSLIAINIKSEIWNNAVCDSNLMTFYDNFTASMDKMYRSQALFVHE